MLKTMRTKIISIVLVAVMAMGIPLSSWAAEKDDMSFRFDAAVNGKTFETVQPGDEVSVEVKLVRTDAYESFSMYAIQYEIWYNSDNFELVDGSLSGGTYSVRVSERALGSSREGWSSVSASALSTTPSGDKWENSQTILSFKLKAIKNGTMSLLQSKNYSVSKTDGMSFYTTSANDASVVIKTPKNENSDSENTDTENKDGEKTDTDKDNTKDNTNGDTDGDNTTPTDPTDDEKKDENQSSIKASERFSDVAAGSWYEEAIGDVVEKGLFSGVSENLFSPNGTMTRAMLVTVLARLGSEETFSGKPDFTDVPQDAWYAAGVAWAASKGIVSGYGDGRFGPNDPITREQMAVIIYNFTKVMRSDVAEGAGLEKFSDSASVDSWALEAVKWAVGFGIMNGNTDGTLNPRGTATRAQVATVMMNYIKAMPGIYYEFTADN